MHVLLVLCIQMLRVLLAWDVSAGAGAVYADVGGAVVLGAVAESAFLG